jgi:hypothetical protein
MTPLSHITLPTGEVLHFVPPMSGEERKFPAYEDLTIKNAPEWYAALHAAFALLCQHYDAVVAEAQEDE